MDNMREMTEFNPQATGHLSKKKKKSPVFHVSDFNSFYMYFLYNAQISVMSAAIIDATTASKPI